MISKNKTFQISRHLSIYKILKTQAKKNSSSIIIQKFQVLVAAWDMANHTQCNILYYSDPFFFCLQPMCVYVYTIYIKCILLACCTVSSAGGPFMEMLRKKRKYRTTFKLQENKYWAKSFFFFLQPLILYVLQFSQEKKGVTYRIPSLKFHIILLIKSCIVTWRLFAVKELAYQEKFLGTPWHIIVLLR